MTKDEAIRQALRDMKTMTPDELRSELNKHRGSTLAVALTEAHTFIKEMASKEAPKLTN